MVNSFFIHQNQHKTQQRKSFFKVYIIHSNSNKFFIDFGKIKIRLNNFVFS